MNYKDIEKAVLESANELIECFQSAPFAFLSESDIQALLFANIRYKLPNKVEVSSAIPDAPPYHLFLTYSEYYQKIDIACLDPQMIKDYLPKQSKGFDTYIFNLPVYVGIELKYRKMGDRFSFAECERDLKKLTSLTPNVQIPFVLGFVQDDKCLEDFLCNVPVERQMAPVNELLEFGPIYVITPTKILPISSKLLAS